MQPGSESESFVLCSERILLECRCGEVMILIGREDDWYSEGRAVFECGCGERLTLANRFVEKDPSGRDTFSVRELLRRFGTPDGQ